MCFCFIPLFQALHTTYKLKFYSQQLWSFQTHCLLLPDTPDPPSQPEMHGTPPTGMFFRSLCLCMCWFYCSPVPFPPSSLQAPPHSCQGSLQGSFFWSCQVLLPLPLIWVSISTYCVILFVCLFMRLLPSQSMNPSMSSLAQCLACCRMITCTNV